MMLECDYLIDVGPGAGRHGGNIVAEGTPKEFVKGKSTTAKYLNGEISINYSKQRRKGSGEKLSLHGATGNNLKNVTLEISPWYIHLHHRSFWKRKSTLIHENPLSDFKSIFF